MHQTKGNLTAERLAPGQAINITPWPQFTPTEYQVNDIVVETSNFPATLYMCTTAHTSANDFSLLSIDAANWYPLDTNAPGTTGFSTYELFDINGVSKGTLDPANDKMIFNDLDNSGTTSSATNPFNISSGWQQNWQPSGSFFPSAGLSAYVSPQYYPDSSNTQPYSPMLDWNSGGISFTNGWHSVAHTAGCDNDYSAGLRGRTGKLVIRDSGWTNSDPTNGQDWHCQSTIFMNPNVPFTHIEFLQEGFPASQILNDGPVINGVQYSHTNPLGGVGEYFTFAMPPGAVGVVLNMRREVSPGNSPLPVHRLDYVTIKA